MDFLSEELCSVIINGLVRGESYDTREYIKPLYRWLKNGSRHYDVEKAFQFTSWVEKLQKNGDNSLKIIRQSAVQPKFMYNTIVTMSQRNNDSDCALRAYNALKDSNYIPDVFTLTALFDVIGRNGRYLQAIEMYKEMLHSKICVPNVVTFVTLIRLSKYYQDIPIAKHNAYEILRDACSLSDEHNNSSNRVNQVQIFGENGTLDVSIYNAALGIFLRYHDTVLFNKVLKDMANSGAVLNSQTFDIISKLYLRHHFAASGLESETGAGLEGKRSELHAAIEVFALNVLVDHEEIRTDSSCPSMRSRSVISDEILPMLITHVEQYVLGRHQSKVEGIQVGKPSHSGCLGQDTPASLRQTVILHDLTKLLERLLPENGNDCLQLEGGEAEEDVTSRLVEFDYVTLLHQCRKRKWMEQIMFIVKYQEGMGFCGVSDCRSNLFVPPLAHLRPTIVSYECALEGLFNMQRSKEAWELFSSLMYEARGEDRRVQELVSEAKSFHRHRIGSGLDVPEVDDDCGEASRPALLLEVQSHRIRVVQSMDLSFYNFMIAGFYHCREADLAWKVYQFMRGFSDDRRSTVPHQPLAPTEKMMLSILRGLGLSGHIAMSALRDWVGLLLAGSGVERVLQNSVSNAVLTLLESVVVLGGGENIFSEMIERMLHLCDNSNSTGSGDQASFAIDSCISGSMSAFLRQPCDSRYLQLCLMLSCSDHNLTKAYEVIEVMQARGHFPPLLALYSLTAECIFSNIQSKSQIETSKSLKTLPYRSFGRFGAVSYVAQNKEKFIHYISGVVLSMGPVCSLSLNALNFNGKKAAGSVSALFGSQWLRTSVAVSLGYYLDKNTVSYPHEHKEMFLDEVLDWYTTQYEVLRAAGDIHDARLTDSTYSSSSTKEPQRILVCCYLQHLYSRFLMIRSKEEKHALVAMIATSLAVFLSNREKIIIFLCDCVANVHLLDVSGKQHSKLIGVILQAIGICMNFESDRTQEGSVTPVRLCDLIPEAHKLVVLKTICACQVNLDIVKELYKEVIGSNSSHSQSEFNSDIDESFLEYVVSVYFRGEDGLSCAEGSGGLDVDLHSVVNRQVQILQYLDQQNLFFTIRNNITVRKIIESSLVSTFRRECEREKSENSRKANIAMKSWTGLLIYISGIEKHNQAPSQCNEHACLPIARLLLESPCSNSDAASRIVCKYNVADTEEFQWLLSPTLASVLQFSDSDAAEAVASDRAGSGDVPHWTSEGVEVAIVDTLETVELARNRLANCLDGGVVGIDVEWRPYGTGYLPTKCSLLQLSYLNNVFLFDLMALESAWASDKGGNNQVEDSTSMGNDAHHAFSELMESVFSSEKILKIGYHLANDWNRLQQSFPLSLHYRKLVNHAELSVLEQTPSQKISGGKSDVARGMSALCLMYTGKRLNKAMQCSDWQRRPLLQEQISYAALDAHVLLQVWTAKLLEDTWSK